MPESFKSFNNCSDNDHKVELMSVSQQSENRKKMSVRVFFFFFLSSSDEDSRASFTGSDT